MLGRVPSPAPHPLSILEPGTFCASAPDYFRWPIAPFCLASSGLPSVRRPNIAEISKRPDVIKEQSTLRSEIPLIHAELVQSGNLKPARRPSIPLVPPSLHCLFFPPNRLRPIRLLKAVSHNVDIHIRRNSTAPQARNPGLPTLPPLHLRPIHLGPELIAYLFHAPPLIFTSFLSHGGRPHFLCLLATIPLPFDHPFSLVGPCLVPRQPRHVSPLAGPPEPVRGHPGYFIACFGPPREQLGDRINHFRRILPTAKQTNTGPDSSRRP